MEVRNISFDLLYERCVYSSLAHAVFTFREPFFAYEQSWDNDNYSFYTGSTRGTISFQLTRRFAAGAARDDKSSRRSWYPMKHATELFSFAPREVLQLSQDETMEYLYDTINGVLCPIATVAMWHDGEKLYLSDPEAEFVQNGGSFFALLSDASFDLSEYWKNQYSLTDSEIVLVNQLKGAVHTGLPFIIPKPLAKNLKLSKGLKDGLESLLELGIIAQL